MAVNKKAVMISIKKMIDKIHTDGYGGLFNNKVVKAPIHSVPEEYKILYKDIPIDIDKIGNLFAYYHYNINRKFESLTVSDNELLNAFSRMPLSHYINESFSLIDKLNLIGCSVQFIRYNDEIEFFEKNESSIPEIKICEYEPIFGMLENGQITDIQNIEKITQKSANEQIKKCNSKIKSGDYSGAITNSRSLVEGVIKDIYKKITKKNMKSEGNLPKDWEKLSQKINLHSEEAPSNDLKTVTKGLVSIIHGLAAVRNKMSDSHGNAYEAKKHHAILAVSTAFTITEFLYGAYDYHVQQQQGELIPREDANVPPFSLETTPFNNHLPR